MDHTSKIKEPKDLCMYAEQEHGYMLEKTHLAPDRRHSTNSPPPHNQLPVFRQKRNPPNRAVPRESTHLTNQASCQPSQIEHGESYDSKVCAGLIHEMALLQTQLFQTEKLAALGTFAAGIAHDINNPLYVMIGLAENMLDKQNSVVIQDQMRSIVNAGKRIQRTCRNITQYAHAINGVECVSVDVAHTLDEAVKIAQYACPLQDFSVARHYAKSLQALACPDELLQAFVNLMTNSIQAMKGKGTLTISSWAKNRVAHISISDTGCGISSENIEKIFQPFFTTKPRGEGTGLGLHNVRAIIQKYNGELLIESQPEKGTTILVQLPNAQAA